VVSPSSILRYLAALAPAQRESTEATLDVVERPGDLVWLGDVDLRFLWMRQKRLQGSHFANTQECAAITELVARGIVDPCLSAVAPFAEVGHLHQQMYENRHPPGNMAVLVNAPEPGLSEVDL